MLVNCDIDKFWGQHLMLDCKSGNENVTRLEAIQPFIDDLVKKIDMQKHGELKVERFGKGDLVGISFCQFIETSSIVGHFCDSTRNLYLDIFSCKQFLIKEVIDVVRAHFNPEMIKQINLNRGV